MITFLKNLFFKLFDKKEKQLPVEVDPFGDVFREKAKKIINMKYSDISEEIKNKMIVPDIVTFGKNLTFEECGPDILTLNNLSPGAKKEILKLIREDQNAGLETFATITELIQNYNLNTKN